MAPASRASASSYGAHESVVFTVEYLIRSAQLAVYGVLDLQMKPAGVCKGRFDPRAFLTAFRALHDLVA